MYWMRVLSLWLLFVENIAVLPCELQISVLACDVDSVYIKQLNCFSLYFIDHLWVLFPDVCMVIASEIAVDIVKHAFITKFNDITADVCIFITILVFDVDFYLI